MCEDRGRVDVRFLNACGVPTGLSNFYALCTKTFIANQGSIRISLTTFRAIVNVIQKL